MISRIKTRHWLNDLFLLASIFAIFYCILLSYRPLAVPDEARYAEVPREMVVMHNYVTPHLDGIKYFEKPALFYWLQAGAIKLWGATPTAARIPNTCMALLGCLLAYCLGRTLYDRRTGLISATILATSALYFVLGQLVTLDMTLSTLITGGLTCFLIALKRQQNVSSRISEESVPQNETSIGNAKNSQLEIRLLYYGFYACTALAVLTKGLVGLFLPAGIIGAWVLLHNEWRQLKKIYLPTGLIVFLLVALPWHLLVQLQNPEFLKFYFWDQQFARYFTSIANRYQPYWFFIPVLLLGFLPWVCFLFQSLSFNMKSFWQNKQKESLTLFLLMWPIVIFTFFSLSQSKLIPYILPVFPPLCVLLGRYFSHAWEKNSKGIFAGYILLFLLMLGLSISAFFVMRYGHIDILTRIHSEINLLSAIWITGTTLALIFIFQRHTRAAFISLVLCSLAAYQVVVYSMPKVDIRSVQPLAMTLKPMLQPGDEVVAFDTYYQDLPFYLQKRVVVVDWLNELEFGTHHQTDAAQWVIDENNFWPTWENKKQIYLLMDIAVYQRLMSQHQYPLYLIAETEENVLLSNHPIAHPLFSPSHGTPP